MNKDEDNSFRSITKKPEGMKKKDKKKSRVEEEDFGLEDLSELDNLSVDKSESADRIEKMS